MSKVSYIGLVVICLLFTGAIVAQEEEVPPIELEVAVEAEKIEPTAFAPPVGTAVTTVDAQEIKATAAKTIVDALQYTPGVQIRKQGRMTEDQLTYRGCNPTAVLVDGQPIMRGGGYAFGCAGGERFSNRSLYSLPVEQIERIEVIRDSGTVLYGPAGSSGGVINIITKTPKGPLETLINTEMGSYDHRVYRIALSQGDKPFKYLLDIKKLTEDSNLKWGSKDFLTIFGKATANFKDGSYLRLNIQTTDGERNVDMSADPTVLSEVYWRFNPWTERYMSASYAHPTSPKQNILWEIYHRNRRNDMIMYRKDAQGNPIFSLPYANEYNLQDKEWGGDLIWSLNLSAKDFVRTGLQYRRLAIDDRTLKPSFGPGTTLKDTLDMKSLFAENVHTLSLNWKIDYGLRYDKPSDRDAGISYSLGAEYAPTEDITYFSHIGTGVQLPSYAECKGLPGVKSQRSLHFDWGLDRRLSPNSLFTASTFFSRINDTQVGYNANVYKAELIAAGYNPNNPPLKYEDMNLWGLELSWDWRINKESTYFANYSYFRGSLTRNMVPKAASLVTNAPRNTVNLGWRYNNSAKKLQANITAGYVDNYLAYAGYTPYPLPVGKHLVANGRVSYLPNPDTEWYLILGNILNTNYKTMPGFPAPDRNFGIGYSTKF